MFVSLNNNGYLPPGWHVYDLTKLQEDFVEQFNESTPSGKTREINNFITIEDSVNSFAQILKSPCSG